MKKLLTMCVGILLASLITPPSRWHKMPVMRFKA